MASFPFPIRSLMFHRKIKPRHLYVNDEVFSIATRLYLKKAYVSHEINAIRFARSGCNEGYRNTPLSKINNMIKETANNGASPLASIRFSYSYAITRHT